MSSFRNALIAAAALTAASLVAAQMGTQFPGIGRADAGQVPRE